MDNLKTYEFGADAVALRDAQETGTMPELWEGAFRAMVADVVSTAGGKPRSIYLCSADGDAEARNRFGFLLAKLVRERAQGVTMVDCDFLSVGLGGIVPHRDALGFLDLLLYGTSLGVVAQETAGGVRVVGAGSFAVTKKNPFATDAFVTARRYLAQQTGCVIFVGPVADDENDLHPIARNVDAVILVRTGERFDDRFPDPLEQRIASVEGVEARSVRLNTKAALPAARRESAREEDTVPETVARGAAEGARPQSAEMPWRPARRSEREVPAVAGRADDRRAAPEGPSGGESKPPAALRRARASRAVRIIASVAALSAVVFVVWWLYLTRSVREEPAGKAETAGRPAASAESPPADSAGAVREQGATGAALSEENGPASAGGAIARREEPESAAADAGAREATGPGGIDTAAADAGAREATGPGRIDTSAGQGRTGEEPLFVKTLGSFAEQYVIHVSSFRGTDKAKEEAAYLAATGYPVFVYHVDTGSKGMWYRVYVGPYATRDEAMNAKIGLDENPRIRSTRVSKVPG